MMVMNRTDHNDFEISCGICGTTDILSTDSGEWDEAKEIKRKKGWTMGRNDAEDWVDICVVCREKRCKGR